MTTDKMTVVIKFLVRWEVKPWVYKGCKKEEPKKNMDISSRN